MTRAQLFKNIANAFCDERSLVARDAVAVLGDSLSLLKRIPDSSVSLILTDPPYHSTKKSNIYGDTDFAKDDDFIEWISQFIAEWRRIIRPNGSIYCFCATEMSARIEMAFSEKFNILSHIVWTKPNEPGYDGWKGKMKKEALRQWYPHSERVIFCEPATPGNLHRSPFGSFLREMRNQAGLSGHALTELTGAYGKVNHGGAVSNWETGRNIPSKDQYEKICQAFIDTGNVSFMPPYEDVIRPFDMDAKREFTDVWNFPSVKVYKGKHPAEKPADMLEHIIRASSFPGDIVLDCFGGSGSTALAALRLNRRTISFEIEEQWFAKICDRISISGQEIHSRTEGDVSVGIGKDMPSLPLFSQD